MSTFFQGLRAARVIPQRLVPAVLKHQQSRTLHKRDVVSDETPSAPCATPIAVTRTPYTTDSPAAVVDSLMRNGVCVVNDRSSTNDSKACFSPFLVGVNYPAAQRFDKVLVHQLAAVFKIDGDSIVPSSRFDCTFVRRQGPKIFDNISKRFWSHLSLVGPERASAAQYGRMAWLTYFNPTSTTAIGERRFHQDRGFSLWIRKTGDPGARLKVEMHTPRKQGFTVDINPSFNLSVLIDNAYGFQGNTLVLPPGAVAHTVTTELLTESQALSIGKRTPTHETLRDYLPRVINPSK